MLDLKLQAKKRDLLGRKVKNLRVEGLVPANVYGKNVKSQAVSLNKDDLKSIFSQAGETGVVQLTIEGEKEARPILIQNLHQDPVSEEILHADLRQIILTEKVSADIPIELSGESPAVDQKLGILIQTLSEIEVEALPMDLPEKFVADVSKLLKVGDQITVKDLSIDQKKVDLKAEEELVVAKIEPLAAEEVAPPPTTETVEGEGVAEGEEKPAGDKTADESAPEEKPAEEKEEPAKE